MSMEWWNKIRDILQLGPRISVEKKTISRRSRIELGKFKECEVGVVRRERPLWREDKGDLVHKEPGKDVKYTPLK